MLKKNLLLICLIFFTSCTGYEPIYNNSNSRIYVQDVTYKDNTNISKQIAKKINSLYSKDDNSTKVSIELNSSNEEYILSKDKQGDPLIFEIKINVEMSLFFNEMSKKFTFKEKKSFNNQENKFELQQYKKNIESNLIESIFEKIIFSLNEI